MAISDFKTPVETIASPKCFMLYYYILFTKKVNTFFNNKKLQFFDFTYILTNIF